ncbi:MAG: DUF4926 domain-containing protein [Chloroflexaceae bacterium]|nr:DUF4926 domain-containing protein [Chloroflexaceae bacterium]NJO08141.1 DUF4926 domain-containing protein [Chloroflexaceae bacterium]
MIQEYEQVVLTEDLPEHDLKAGDLGTVVMIHGDHAGYELEIFSAGGRTLDVVTVEAHQVRPVSRRDVLHVRELTV